MGCSPSKVAPPGPQSSEPPSAKTAGAGKNSNNKAGPQRYAVRESSTNGSDDLSDDEEQKQFSETPVTAVSRGLFSGGPKTEEQKKRAATLDYLDKKVDKEFTKLHQRDRRMTALLLGTGECGKSTVFKQLRLCYGNGFDRFEREQYAKIVWADALRAIRMLIDMCCEELRSEDCDPGLRVIVRDWLGGHHLGATPLDEEVEIEVEMEMEAASAPPPSITEKHLFGPVDAVLIRDFRYLFTQQDDEDFLFEQEFGGRTVESRAVRNAVRLLQSTDMSREAFLSAEQNGLVKNFLQGHAQNGQKKRPRKPADPAQLMRNVLEGIVDDSYSDGPATPVGGYGGLADAFSRNDVTEYEEVTLRPKRRVPLQSSMTTATATETRAVLAAAVHLLWETCPPLIKSMVASNQLGLETNAKYFLDNVGKFVPQNYLASDEDILRGRIKTVGLTSFEFNVRGSALVVTDAGGQKTERPRWLYNFDDTSSILYVANVASYDQMLDDGSNMTLLDEALNVFIALSDSHWFRAKGFQLILNKIDILEEKCKKSSFSKLYPQFKGDDRNPREIVDFIEQKFRKHLEERGQPIYVYKTCATDTKMMQFVIASVSDMMLQENLRWLGMF